MSDKVSLLMLSDYATNMEGDIAGFPPDEAARLVETGKAMFRTEEGMAEAHSAAETVVEPATFEGFIHGLLPATSAGKVYEALTAAGIDSEEALAAKTAGELVALPVIGKKTAQKLLEAVAPLGTPEAVDDPEQAEEAVVTE